MLKVRASYYCLSTLRFMIFVLYIDPFFQLGFHSHVLTQNFSRIPLIFSYEWPQVPQKFFLVKALVLTNIVD